MTTCVIVKKLRRYILSTVLALLVLICAICLFKVKEIRDSRARLYEASDHIRDYLIADPNYCVIHGYAQTIDPNVNYVEVAGVVSHQYEVSDLLHRILPDFLEKKLFQTFTDADTFITVELYDLAPAEVLKVKKMVSEINKWPDIPIKFWLRGPPRKMPKLPQKRESE